MAYGDIIEYNGNKYRCINPDLTSNTTPAPYYANASAEYIYDAKTGSGRAFSPFIEPPAGVTLWLWSPNHPPNWIGIGMGDTPVSVDLMVLVGPLKNATRNIILYGSNDGGVTLERIKEFRAVMSDKVPYYVELEGQSAYKYYRIYTSSINLPEWNGFNAIRFYEKVKEERFLLQDNTGYKTIVEGNLQEAEKADIATVGFTDLQLIKEVSSQMGNPYSLLRYDTQKASTAIQLEHLPEPQLIVPVGDIDLSAYSSIRQITLSTSGTSGAVRVIFSFDGGITWNTFSGGAWVTIEPVASTVITDGITPEHVALIPSEQWATVITNRLRIAYCLSKSAVTDDIAVDCLTVTGSTSAWKRAQRTVDYSCQLPNTGTMIIELLKDGSYKINYMEAKQK